ncbi:MAG: dhaL [Steroidobacteraceae bacterium]|nr:dhaL [Steroidobacteraceae bacterium]
MTVPQSRAEWHRRAAELRYANGHFIDAEHVPARASRFTVVNPALAQPLCEVAAGDAKVVDAAVASALRAHRDGAWRRMAPRERLQVMNRLADLIDRHTAEFVLLDTLCMGKPVRDMLAVDVPQSSLTFRYFAELSDKVEGAVTATAADAFHYTLREPLGVVGCITPWNYPLMQIAWKIAPALAAGNTVVLKAAEQAPLSALLLAQLFVEAGAPAGVLNVVSGTGADAGAPLALHPDVAKISFTGSTATGKKMLVYSGK